MGEVGLLSLYHRARQGGTIALPQNRGMTTINNIEDPFRLPDANAEYREGLRRRVLAEELLTLTARLTGS